MAENKYVDYKKEEGASKIGVKGDKAARNVGEYKFPIKPENKILSGQGTAKKSNKLVKHAAGFAAAAVAVGLMAISGQNLDNANSADKKGNNAPASMIAGNDYSLKGADEKLVVGTEPVEHDSFYVNDAGVRIDNDARGDVVLGTLSKLTPNDDGSYNIEYEYVVPNWDAELDKPTGEGDLVKLSVNTGANDGSMSFHSGDMSFEVDNNNAVGDTFLVETTNVEPVSFGNANSIASASEKVLAALPRLEDGVDDDYELRLALRSLASAVEVGTESNKSVGNLSYKTELEKQGDATVIKSFGYGDTLDEETLIDGGASVLNFHINEGKDGKGIDSVVFDNSYTPPNSDSTITNHFVVDGDGNVIVAEEIVSEGGLTHTRDAEFSDSLKATFGRGIVEAAEEFLKTGEKNKAFGDVGDHTAPGEQKARVAGVVLGMQNGNGRGG